MKRYFGSRKTASLSKSVHRQLNMYALAAGAAGVGILALAPPAGAKIIYTPLNVAIGPGGSLKLDLNHDGKPDFRIGVRIYTKGTSLLFSDSMYVQALQKSNAAAVGGMGFARAINRGVTIGPKQVFGGDHKTVMASCHSAASIASSKGPWLNVRDRYLGLRFTIKGKIHYGWARLTTNTCTTEDFLSGYAYETIPNKPIVTGATKGTGETADRAEVREPRAPTAPASKPATLGALAMGGPGLSIWRREDPMSATSERN
jgi:hypothetical protein